MSNKNKEGIYLFLKANRGFRYTMSDIVKETGISRPTVAKWVPILKMEERRPPVKIEKYGNIKLVFVEKLNAKEKGH